MRTAGLRLALASPLVAIALTAESARAEEHVELGPDAGVVNRPARGSNGFDYGAAFTFGGHVQIPAAPWLRITTYYLHASQPITAKAGALGVSDPVVPDGRLASYVLGAKVQPTWSPAARVHLWLDLGAAWGIMTSPLFHVSAPAPYDIMSQDSAFTELPFGFGGEFDFPPWFGVTADVDAGPTIGGFDPSAGLQAVDTAGRLINTRSPAQFAWMFAATVGVVLHL